MRYLFIDRRHVQRMDAPIRHVFHQPVKDRGPVLAPERPHEGERLHLWSAPVWCDQRRRWRMWYIGGEDLLPLYAESQDGVHWERPELGCGTGPRAGGNNLIDLGFDAASAKERRIVVLRDEKASDPSQRFMGLTRIHRGGTRLIPLTSPDGLAWKPLDGGSVPSDDEYRLGYDAVKARYVATVKDMQTVPEFGRAVALSVSEDFRHWTERRLVFWADEQDIERGRAHIEEAFDRPDRRSPLVHDPSLYHTDVYNMPMFTYEGLYIGLPVLFHHSGLYWYEHPDDAPPQLRSNQDGVLYPVLALSDTLDRWERPHREPFLPLSPLTDDENYDYGAIHAAAPVPAGEELWFYYTGTRFTHVKKNVLQEAGQIVSREQPMGAVFRARLRRDGFASLSAGERPGMVLSTPVDVDGARLHVNADAGGGELRAEIRDAASGRVIPGYSMGDIFGDRYLHSDDGHSRRLRSGTGARRSDDAAENTSRALCSDRTDAVMCWKDGNRLEALKGRSVRICFFLRNTDLYAFWFGA